MLSEEEIQKRYSDDKLEDLYKLYHEVDREVEKAKGRRTWLATGAFFVLPALFIIALSERFSILQFLFLLAIAAVSAIVRFWFFFPIFSWLCHKNTEDHERREKIILRIQAAKKRAGYRPSVEDVIARGIGGIDLLQYNTTPDESDDLTGKR